MKNVIVKTIKVCLPTAHQFETFLEFSSGSIDCHECHLRNALSCRVFVAEQSLIELNGFALRLAQVLRLLVMSRRHVLLLHSLPRWSHCVWAMADQNLLASIEQYWVRREGVAGPYHKTAKKFKKKIYTKKEGEKDKKEASKQCGPYKNC